MPALIALPNIQRGDTIPFTFNFTDGTDPIDLRGKTVVMTLKLSPQIEDEDATIIKSIAFDLDDEDAENGVANIRLESSDTRQTVVGVSYHFALRVIQASEPEDIETTYLYGTIKVDDV